MAESDCILFLGRVPEAWAETSRVRDFLCSVKVRGIWHTDWNGLLPAEGFPGTSVCLAAVADAASVADPSAFMRQWRVHYPGVPLFILVAPAEAVCALWITLGADGLWPVTCSAAEAAERLGRVLHAFCLERGAERARQRHAWALADAARSLALKRAKLTLCRELLYVASGGRLLLLEHEEFDLYTSGFCSFSLHQDLLKPPDVSRARMTAGRICQEYGCDAELSHSVMLAVSEAAGNVVKHGGGGKMSLGLDKESSTLLMCFTDSGPGINEAFLVDALFCAGASSRRSLGFGFSILLDRVDSLLLATDNRGTGLLLSKNLRATASRTPIDDEVLARL